MLAISPTSATVASGGATQQFNCDTHDAYITWQLSDQNGTVWGSKYLGCTISAGGLLTTDAETGSLNVVALSYDGESASVPVTVT